MYSWTRRFLSIRSDDGGELRAIVFDAGAFLDARFELPEYHRGKDERDRRGAFESVTNCGMGFQRGDEDIGIQQVRHGVSIPPGKRLGVCVRRRFELDAALGPAGPEDIGSATRPVGNETRNDPAASSDRHLLAFFDGGE